MATSATMNDLSEVISRKSLSAAPIEVRNKNDVHPAETGDLLQKDFEENEMIAAGYEDGFRLKEVKAICETEVLVSFM